MIRFTSVQLAGEEGVTHDQRMQKAEACLEKIYAGEERPVQILFPEIWATGFFNFDNYYTESEEALGATYEMMSAWARKIGCYIHTGSSLLQYRTAYRSQRKVCREIQKDAPVQFQVQRA